MHVINTNTGAQAGGASNRGVFGARRGEGSTAR